MDRIAAALSAGGGLDLLEMGKPHFQKIRILMDSLLPTIVAELVVNFHSINRSSLEELTELLTVIR